jgi:flavin reductase (DIM6/NTAB) family NADH-FMN oxidoreductase RutF
MAASTSRRLTPEEFREVIGHFASGVTVITVSADGTRYGATASAVSSLAVEPPMVLVCMNRASQTNQAIASAGRFAINILDEGHGDLALRFASRTADKFAGVPTRETADGVPVLDAALASLVCRVSEQVIAATHTVFLAEVDEATARAGAPLAYYRGRFGRLELSEDQVIHREIRQRLLAGRPLSSTRLDVERLAGELNAERGPVFHALSKLAAEGLLDRTPDGSFTPRAPSDELVSDVYAARRSIELGVAHQVVGRVSAEDLRTLRRLMEATLPLIADGEFVDVDRWIRANDAFHEFIVGLAGSATLVQSYRGLGLGGLDAHDLTMEHQADQCLLDDHRDLVEAFERADIDGACAAIDRHSQRPMELRRRVTG